MTSQEALHKKRIALLTTGDEITTGDILNTNAREIACCLTDHHMLPRHQMAVADHLDEIEQAIRHLLATHDSLIITGGLGPTSDDLTRFALAKALNQPLVFDDTVWESIVRLLNQYGYTHPPDSNRQQALFPKGARILQNTAGTAAGCEITWEGKPVFMLPGPPTECLPMMQHFVLPSLAKAGFARKRSHKRWMLFGVSEGQIAEKLDSIAFRHHCETGYRLCYPYVEFKLYSDNEADFKKAAQTLEQTFLPHLIGNGEETASLWCLGLLKTKGKTIAVCDLATGGLLEHTLRTPETNTLLQFVKQEDSPDILIKGLDDFWKGINTPKTPLHLIYGAHIGRPSASIDAPLRGPRVKQFAVEWACLEIGKWLSEG